MKTQRLLRARSLHCAKRMCALAITFCCFIFFSPIVFSAENTSSKLEIIGKTHTIATFQRFDGPGSEVKGLANTYDMSIFEFNWGGRQSTFNKSGITTNSNFPLTDGEAISNNTHIGLSAPLTDDLKAGFLMELYGLIGDRTVGRAFGEELPWDNFPRENGAIQTPHFLGDIYNGFLEGSFEKLKYKFVGGSLTPRDLPEFTRKEMNQVKLGSLVYRAPITNASFFEKEDRKIEEGRHPLRGFDFIGDYEYLDKEHLHLELFTGATEPTPLSDIERDAYGGRGSIDVLEGNVGFTYVFNNGLRPVTGIAEKQGVWSIDSSYKVFDWLVPYFTFAETDYDRGGQGGESHAGDAYVAGLLIKWPKGYEWKGQYQRVGENYDLMAYHKSEHYPGNFQGFSGQFTAPLTEQFKMKGVVYYVEQIDTAVTSTDTLFGDSFFPSIKDSKRGTIGVERLGADWKVSPELSLSGYVEHAHFRKAAPKASADIDKDVYNFSGSLTLNFTKEFYAEGGFRHFFSVGDWQAMNFRSYQNISEAAIGYKIDKDRHALLIYHYYNFEDGNAISLGRNDYYGHQVIFEIKTLL